MPTHGPINRALAIPGEREACSSLKGKEMPESLEDLIMLQPPTADRPLLGTIVLVVEDSRHACEVLRLICQRSGARIRRAESLASAERHLRTYRPRIAVIDLGLPDGSGLELIEKLARPESGIDGIIAMSGDDTLHEAALQAGAHVFLAKPLVSVSHFQTVALELLPAELRPSRVSRPSTDTITPDPVALRDDLALAADLLRTDPDTATLDYLGGFLASLGKDAGDKALIQLGGLVRGINTPGPDTAKPKDLARAVEDRMNALQPV